MEKPNEPFNPPVVRFERLGSGWVRIAAHVRLSDREREHPCQRAGGLAVDTGGGFHACVVREDSGRRDDGDSRSWEDEKHNE